MFPTSKYALAISDNLCSCELPYAAYLTFKDTVNWDWGGQLHFQVRVIGKISNYVTEFLVVTVDVRKIRHIIPFCIHLEANCLKTRRQLFKNE